MELTYQEAGKPLPKAYDGEEGLIVFTLGRMEEGIMEKLSERRLQTTGSDSWIGRNTRVLNRSRSHRRMSNRSAISQSSSVPLALCSAPT